LNPNDQGSLTDWHRWVPPEVRRDVLSFMARAFVIGMVLGGAAGAFYWKYSVSKEKIFQGAIIVAALAFTMPAFATSLKLMLSMFYMSWAGQEKADGVWRNLKEIKDEVKPVVENAGKIMDNLARVVERYGKNDLVKSFIDEAKSALAKEGGIIQKIDRLTLAIEALSVPAPGPKKPGLLERGIQPRGAPAAGSPQADEETRVLQAGHAT
jgi:type III secretory pathway component EscR